MVRPLGKGEAAEATGKCWWKSGGQRVRGASEQVSRPLNRVRPRGTGEAVEADGQTSWEGGGP